MGSPEQIIGIALGYVLSALVRYLFKARFWRSVAREAAKQLADPTVPVDDPVSATEKALAEKQHHQVVAIARTITDSGRISTGRTPSTLIDRPFQKRQPIVTPPGGYRITPPRGGRIIKGKPRDDD